MRKYKYNNATKYILYYIVAITILLSFTTINNSYINDNDVSALDYSSNVGIGFTFNPTLSVSISPSDLIIDNLIPGNTLDSNSINVSVATNAAYGYTLSANVNDENLVHSNNIDTFSSIDTNADLSSLDDSEDDNIWGYSYKNNIASTPTWSNYSGLSRSINKVLFNADSNSSGSIDFKMAAKASETQPSGTYTGTINFIATTKPIPKTIQDIAYMQTFAELDAVDLASVKSSMVLNSDYILKDIRDEKEYYVTRLEDGNVWMTQNLDLDLIQNKTYTHTDTDLGWSPNSFNPDATWVLNTDPSWGSSKSTPYFVDNGDKYAYTSNSDADDIIYNSLADCTGAGHTDCAHYHLGNYYNWNAARADGDVTTSICPAGWRLPDLNTNEFGNILVYYDIIATNISTDYLENGFNKMRKKPLYFVRGGGRGDYPQSNTAPGIAGTYFYDNTTLSAGYMNFKSNTISPIYNNRFPQIRGYGYSVRCLAR